MPQLVADYVALIDVSCFISDRCHDVERSVMAPYLA